LRRRPSPRGRSRRGSFPTVSPTVSCGSRCSWFRVRLDETWSPAR
jgi:hypothetical protein